MANDDVRGADVMNESARTLLVAARLARIGYWEDDLVANRIWWSEEVCGFLGVPVTQRTLSWDEFLALVHPDDRAAVVECRIRVAKGEPSYVLPLRLNRPDGDTVFAEAMGEGIQSAQGGVVRAVGAIQDVSERRRAAEVLRASEERLRLALDATHLGPWEWNLETNTVVFWPEWKRQIGYEPDEIPDRYEEWESRLHPDDRERVLGALYAYLDDRAPDYNLEFRLRHKNGRYRWIYTRGAAPRDADGRRTHMIGCHVDITEWKELQEQYRQSQKMQAIGQLAGGIAHDFNNLLVVISGYAELIAAELDPAHHAQSDLAEIRAAAKSAAGLTRQLLAFGRRQILEPQVLDPNLLLRRVQQLLRRVIGEHIAAEMHLAASGRVYADPGQIEQVIMNLAVNARDAMPNGGRLTIETADVVVDAAFAAEHPGAKAGRHVSIVVTDSGEGMDETTRVHLFEPFFTTKSPGQGTGLGLATVYGIVKQSGGWIAVESEPGLGARFTIYLPAVEAPLAPVEPPDETQRLAGTETVLVLEDQQEVRELIHRTLRRFGYLPLVAANGAEALEIAKAHEGPIHAMLTDIVLPGISGRNVARQVVVDRPSIRVLYMSGYTDDTIVHHGVLEPGLAFIQKPFTAEVLVRKVRDLLDARQAPKV